VPILLCNTKIERTVRDLGIEVDDALAIAEQIDVLTTRAELTCSARPGPVEVCQVRTHAPHKMCVGVKPETPTGHSHLESRSSWLWTAQARLVEQPTSAMRLEPLR